MQDVPGVRQIHTFETASRRRAARAVWLRSVAAAALIGLAACDGGGGQHGPGSDASNASGADAQIVDSLVLAAEASEASRDWAGASQYWRSLLQRDPTNERYAIGLTDSLRHTGHYGEAVQVMTEVLQIREPTPGLLGALGKAQLASGRRDEAIATLNQAALMAPNDWQVQSALAVAYGMAGQTEVADQHYRQALSLTPGNAIVLNNYALHLAISGRLDEGLVVMEQAADVVSAPTQVHQNLALLLAIKGDLPAAEEIVRSELPRDAADQQMAFLRTLSSADLINLGNLVQQSTLDIDSTALPPPASTGSIADLTNLGASGSDFLADQPGVVVEEQSVPAPAEPATPPLEPAAEETLQGDLLAIEVEQETPAVEQAAQPEIVETTVTATAMETEPAIVDAPDAPVTEEAVDAAVPEAASGQTLAQESAAVSAALAEALDTPALVIAPPAEEPAAAETELAPVVVAPAPPPEEEEVAVAAEPAQETLVAVVPEQETASAAPASGPWHVQLGSLATQDAAERGRSQVLAAHGGLLEPVGVAVVEARLDNGGTTWRLLAGGFAEKAPAVDLCERIKAEGGDCFVMKDSTGG